MKKGFILVTLTFIALTGFAQSTAFEKNKLYISGGYGFGNLGVAVFRDLGSVLETRAVGPLHFKAEYAVTEKIGLGVYYAYTQAELETIDEKVDVRINGIPDKLRWNASWRSYSFLLRFNAHFGENEKLDPYLGFGMGFRDWKYSATSNDNQKSDASALVNVGFETTFGLRYFPVPRIGMFTELGLSKSLIQFGITGKI
jgi:hypothetical protein